MADFTRINPLKLYETDKEVCPVLVLSASVAVGADQQLIAGSTGKRIRIMGWRIQTDSATSGVYALKSGSGGSVLASFTAPPSTGGAIDFLPIADCGYYETGTGVGLFVTITVSTVIFNIYYILYTP